MTRLRSPGRHHVTAAATALFLVLAGPAASVRDTARPSAGLAALETGLPLLEAPATSHESWQASRRSADQAFAAFLERHGGSWDIHYDERTGRPFRLMGSGVPLLPWTLEAPPQRSEVVALAWGFLTSIDDLHRLSMDELVLDEARTLEALSGAFWTVGFQRVVSGVPVEGSRVTLSLSRGRLILASFERLVSLPDGVEARLDASEAERLGFELLGGQGPGDRVHEPPELVWLPLARVLEPRALSPGGHGFDSRLCWRLSLDRQGEPARWVIYLDASTSELVRFYDETHYVTRGKVTSLVYPRSSGDSPEEMPVENERVDIETQQAWTDTRGEYISGADGNVRFRLQSTLARGGFRVANVSGPEADVTLTGGDTVDHQWNDANSRADERNAFHHLTSVRKQAMTYVNIPWLTTLVVANVNGGLACNAYYDGSANFMAAGCDGPLCCSNTGEIADVMQHEWGHGLDRNNGGAAEQASGEAIGDITAFHATHDSVLGPDFSRPGYHYVASYPHYGTVADPTALRDVSNPITSANIHERCPRFGDQGPKGYEIHCEGQILAGAVWRLSELLREALGESAGWDHSARLHYVAMPSWSSYLSTYDAYLAVDDSVPPGDSNLANGTPNACLIHEAFDAFGIAGTQRACSTPVVKLRIASLRVDDATGDGDGIADVDESFGLALTLANDGNTPASDAEALLSTSFPGVSVSGPAGFPSIPASGRAESTPPHVQVSLAGSVPCGALIPFDVTLSANGMSFSAGLTLRVGRPVATLYSQDFEAGDGGFTGDGGTAFRGEWLRGSPQVTADYGEVFQADGCAQGTSCYYTGFNTSWSDRDTGDVDGGQSIAESPAFSLTGATTPVLSYQRWFVSLDLAYQPADRFEVMLSNGTDQLPLDSVTTSKSAWIESALPLEGTLAFSNQMRLRFIATDITNNGDNLVEAAIDALKVEEYDCSSECAGVPAITQNSLRATKAATSGAATLSWQGSGAGSYNLHRTGDPQALTNIHLDRASIVATSATTSAEDTPPTGTVYWSTFPRDCDGDSVPP